MDVRGGIAESGSVLGRVRLERASGNFGKVVELGRAAVVLHVASRRLQTPFSHRRYDKLIPGRSLLPIQDFASKIFGTTDARAYRIRHGETWSSAPSYPHLQKQARGVEKKSALAQSSARLRQSAKRRASAESPVPVAFLR